MSSNTQNLSFTIDPETLEQADFKLVFLGFSADLLDHQATYDWNGILENAIQNTELPDWVADTLDEAEQDEALILHTLQELLSDASSWMRQQHSEGAAVPLPGSTYQVLTITDEHMSFDQVSLFVEIVDTIPGFGESVGVVGSGIYTKPRF